MKLSIVLILGSICVGALSAGLDLSSGNTSVQEVFSNIQGKVDVSFLRTSTKPSFLIANYPASEHNLFRHSLETTGVWAPEATMAFNILLANACKTSRELVVDVGAHVGYFSGFSAALGCDVVSFEPQFNLAPYFELMRSVNPGFQDRIQHRRFAVSSVAGQQFAMPLLNDPGLGHLVPTSLAKETDFRVTTVTLDEMLKEETRDILLLKIDVEGHELEVLKGASGLLKAGRVRNMFIEMKTDEETRGKREEFLDYARRELGFKVFSINERYLSGMGKNLNIIPVIMGANTFEDVLFLKEIL
mmetsp:Transcript_2601/g.3999  ORF Transcript_2601/g.3999 Transcript_2601/m.3999 type:complete len:302 (-) Transcript_2601:192-1097(-)|eukprot:CAMPEP_0184654204 /NCGR_PEP_ID=MMETSP0308-20130426/11923_1 /TAXON_ID=38269 /ORGANISM="Gloeochaete witrockiana, Strain SAG 46.84" /LENGTH=301 /DNA_ID=CAMNT_0027090103 /DNA_START=65 /DNA_END=970 /DNA_ORIENTATION=+